MISSGNKQAESRAKAWWVVGAGPFNKGTLYQETQFAGEKMYFNPFRSKAPKPEPSSYPLYFESGIHQDSQQVLPGGAAPAAALPTSPATTTSAAPSLPPTTPVSPPPAIPMQAPPYPIPRLAPDPAPPPAAAESVKTSSFWLVPPK